MRTQTDATFGELHSETTGWRSGGDAEPLASAATILFVEDEAFVRDVTSQVLRAAGYEVLIAQNAVEAKRLYEQRPGGVDLLLTDLVLPGETGRQLAAKLSSADLRLKVLFVTGYAEQMNVEEGQGCLPKPFSTSALLGKVRQILAGGLTEAV
jgi:two-component system cell cycle sensor histidine kinase/response regulator CckA